jgi:hypothetical protein
MRTGPEDLEQAIDRLYQLPADAFTGARNTLAAEWKAKGDKDAAARIKALGKPTAVAWAVNQLYWSDRAAFDALVLALAHVASAQRGGLAGGGGPELRDAMRVRNERLQQAVRAAERKLVESGSQGGLGVQQRLAATLEALASPRPSGSVSDVVPGRLSGDLAPRGFEVAFGLGDMDLPPTPAGVPGVLGGSGTPGGSGGDGVPPAGVLEGAEPPRLKERKLSVGLGGLQPRETDSRREAESNVGRLRRELEIAARTLREAESRAEAARNDLESLEARIPPTRARLEEKRSAEAAARQAHDAVRAQLADAEHALESHEEQRD